MALELCHPATGGVDGEGESYDHHDSDGFLCKGCGSFFTVARNLKRHQLYRCLKQPIPLDPIQLDSRGQSQSSTNAGSEKYVTIYKIDKDAEKFISTCNNYYAKFRLCELKENPLAISGFWPILFEYRGNTALEPLDSHVGHSSQGTQILAQILTDGYNFYGEKSMTISRDACVELNGLFYSISDYRYPTTAIHYGSVLIRRDRPIFQVVKSMNHITLSFHPEYFCQIFISPFISTDTEETMQQSSQDSHQNTPDDTAVDDEPCIDLLFSQVSLEEGDDTEENLSQKLSQVSLKSSQEAEVETSPVRKVCEPVSKKPKLCKIKSVGPSPRLQALVHRLPAVRVKTINCNYCGSILTGGVSQLNRYTI